jgi:hypothetical protein
LEELIGFAVTASSIRCIKTDYTPPVSCLAPENLTVSASYTEAIVSWLPAGSEAYWEVIVGSPGFNPGCNGTIYDSVEGIPYVVNNLQPASSFDCYVRAFCDKYDKSTWVGPVNFTTENLLFPPPTNLEGDLYQGGVKLTWDPPQIESKEILIQDSLPVFKQHNGVEVCKDMSGIPMQLKIGNETEIVTNRLALYNNGPIVNSPGTGANGMDESMLQVSSLGMTTYGFGCQLSGANTIADDFEVTGTWTIESFEFFAYQTGSSLTSTITGAYLRIYDGDPRNGGNIVYGGLSTNRMITTEFASIYRVDQTASGSIDRPVMRIVCETNGLILSPGTYWVEYTLDGSLSSGPWAPPITINGSNTTGNASQYEGQYSAWFDLNDNNTLTRQGVPFIINGTSESVLLGLAAYKVYRNDTYLNDVDPGITELFDSPLPPGIYNYEVTAFYTSPHSGESYPAGPIEIVILPCNEPINLNISNISGSSAELNWTAGELETEWEINYGYEGIIPGHEGIITDSILANNYTFNSLSPGTDYDCYIRAVCSEGYFSEWAGPVSFTTESLQVEMETDMFSYHQTETMEITITATNTGSQDIVLTLIPECETTYFIDNIPYRNGIPVTPMTPCTMAFYDIVIPPEGSYNWTHFHNLTETPISSGTHELFGDILANQIHNSQTIQFEILPTGNQLIFEPFEDYDSNDFLVQQANNINRDYWTTWNIQPGSTEDPFVTDEQVFEGNNSLIIEDVNDAVLLLNDLESGEIISKFEIYIPASYNAYFNLLQDFNGINSQWGMQCFFDSNGIGSIDAGAQGAGSFTFNYDEWVKCKVHVDLDNDSAEFWINNNSIVAWQWSKGPFNQGGIKKLDAVNFYAWSDNGPSKYFIDNIDIKMTFTQNLIVPQGWSGISSYITPETDQMGGIFQDILNDLIILQNPSGMFWPAQNINTLNTWNTHEGYWIKVSDDVELTISGTRENNKSLQLAGGWNLIPVLSECNSNVVDLFEGSEIIMAKEVAGYNIYWPEFEINTLEVLEPGRAYFVLMETEAELTFPECDGFKKGSTRANQSNFEYNSYRKILADAAFEISRPTALSHMVATPISVFSKTDINSGDFICAFDALGICHGLTVWENENTSITLFGDDPTTPEKDGFLENEPLEFRLWKEDSNEEFLLDVTFDQSMPNPDLFFNMHGLSAISGLKVSSTGINSLDENIVRIFPNPTRDKVNILISEASAVTVTIYDMTGQLLLEDHFTGNKSEIDLSTFESGIYMIEVKGENILKIDRLIKN